MARHRKDDDTVERAPSGPKESDLAIPVDPINEQAVIAAAMVDAEARAALVRRVRADHFLAPQHRAIWAGIADLEARGLVPDRAALARTGGVDVEYLDEVSGLAPSSAPNLALHVDALLWDKQRALAVEGPIRDLLEAIRDPRHAPDRVRAVARRVAESLSGHGVGRHLHDPSEVVRTQVLELRARMAGKRRYPYGVQGLDNDENNEPRMVPGAAPGQVTVLTAVSGGGKSVMAAHIALGLARQRRRVLYGAWEMRGGMTLELLTCISLGWSRSALQLGKLDEQSLATFERTMREIAKWVRFMRNPFFQRGSGKPSNERNLDLIEEHIAVSRAEVFIADLWARCLVRSDPEEEALALTRQQAMLEELSVHGVLLQQQRLKDIEQRADKRPTREGIKGSGAWVEIADTGIGTNRPALWKRVEDNTLEAIVLKQRYGRWPLAVEFDWDADKGMISNGRTVDYERPGEANEVDSSMVGRRPVNVKKGRR